MPKPPTLEDAKKLLRDVILPVFKKRKSAILPARGGWRSGFDGGDGIQYARSEHGRSVGLQCYRLFILVEALKRNNDIIVTLQPYMQMTMGEGVPLPEKMTRVRIDKWLNETNLKESVADAIDDIRERFHALLNR